MPDGRPLYDRREPHNVYAPKPRPMMRSETKQCTQALHSDGAETLSFTGLQGREERTGDRFGLGRECERLG